LIRFFVGGFESININENEIETVKVYCEELELTLNLSLHDNLQPVSIHKINGKNEFTMILKEFSPSS
jgi:SUMO ligase MMS21 Smc5/6 complex component